MRTLRYLVYLAATITAGLHFLFWLSGAAAPLGINGAVLVMVLTLAAAPWLLERHFTHWIGTLALAVYAAACAWWFL